MIIGLFGLICKDDDMVDSVTSHHAMPNLNKRIRRYYPYLFAYVGCPFILPQGNKKSVNKIIHAYVSRTYIGSVSFNCYLSVDLVPVVTGCVIWCIAEEF